MAFTSQITGSPFTTPQSNITAMAYTNVGGVKRIYYASANDFTKIFCMQVNGAADTSREINIQNQGDARTSTCRGLCSDGTYLYAVTGALGNQYIHVYRLSDRTYRANYQLGFHADHYVRGIETFPRPGRTTEKRIDILQDNIVRSYAAVVTASSITMSQQNDGTFSLPTNEMVTSGNWQSIAWDDTTERLLIVAEESIPTPGFPGNFTQQDKVFGFTYTGGRDDREDFLPGSDMDAMTYNGDDDDLYMVHETSTRLYAWGDFPRFNLGNTDLNITEGVTYTLDFTPLVDTGAVVTIRTNINDNDFYDGLSMTNNVMTWTSPQAPQGGATQQTVPIAFRATLGGQTTDHTIPFLLHAAQVQAVQPVWASSAFPRQVVYEPYTPPAGAITPNIRHGFQLNLSEFLAAGTPPFTFTAVRDGGDFPGTFQITTRYVNQQPVHDRLVFNAAAVTSSQLTRYMNITVGNTDFPSSSTQRLNFEVINIVYPSWSAPATVTISDSSSHSYPLFDWLSAEPQVDFEFVGTPDASINAHITNNNLVVRGTPGQMAQNYPVTIKAKNIITGDAGVDRTINVAVSAQQLPPAPPVWLTDTITLTGNKGQTQRIDLNQYIASANPSPSFSVSAPSGVLGQIQGSIEGQHFFEFTIPDTITADLNVTVDITATNPSDSAVKTFNVRGVFTAQAAWNEAAIPAQSARAGEVWELDLKPFATGTPTPTISFNPTPTGETATATLVNGVVRWQVPADLTGNRNEPFGFRAENTGGHADLSLLLNVNNEVMPSWKADPIVIAVTEGDVVRQPLDAYVMGNPTPTLHLGSDASDIPGPNSIRFDGLTMIIDPSVAVISQLAFRFNVIAQSTLGSATKEVTVDVTPIFVDNNEIVLTPADYDEIRKLVDTRLEPKDLPDEIIAGDTVVGGAIAWAVDRMPVVQSNPRNLEEIKNKRRAILYRAAGCLAASVRRDPTPQLGGLEQDAFELSTFLFMKAESMAELANKRLAELGLLTGITADVGIDFIFEVVA